MLDCLKRKCRACFPPTAGNTLEFHYRSATRRSFILTVLFCWVLFLLGTVSENLSIVCQHVLIIKLDMKSTMSSFNSFKGVWISSVCCIGFALLWYILKRGFFLHLNSWKWKCVTYLQILLTDAVGWFKQALKTSLFPFYTPTPISKCSFCFFCSFLLQLHSPPSPAPKFDNHVVSDNEVSVC